MNPYIDKVAEKNMERTFELLIADFLVQNPNFTPEVAKEFARKIIGMAERSATHALKHAFDRMGDRAKSAMIEDAIKNPKIGSVEPLK